MSFFDTVIVQPIFNLLMALYSIIPGGDFGLAVIIFTILVRLAMWPLVVKQMHQVKAMRAMQPELKKIKQRAKGNRQMEGMMTLELYRKHNISPFRSLFIVLIQLPIFFGLYRVIQIFSQQPDQLGHYTYGFVKSISAVARLIADPSIFNQNLLGLVDLTKQAISSSGINLPLFILVILAAYLQYVSSKQTMPQAGTKRSLRQVMAEAADGKQADQSEINSIVMGKMMIVMPLFIALIMLNLPGVLALFSAVSTIVAVVQQHALLRRQDTAAARSGGSSSVTTRSGKERAERAMPAQVVAEAQPAARQAPKAKAPATKAKKARKKKPSSSSKTVVRVVATSTKKSKGGKKR